ncbi:M20/M25/M40 family metallo-hydrolase [Azospirillum halopraeferens]|uniref:M20/M25/M40 family metallo-hydrolase n=1 Tax=Azospirillum halopraeferens TaxID=34010 RepID=UPI00040EF255|nr:M20/M25/M40 family metallo-hydrolase [Azospirillum halopraeferens]
MTASLPVDAVLAEVDRSFPDSVARLCDLLRIPSVSTKPDHAPEVRRAAEWLRGELAGLGFEATVRDTEGHPMVVAHHPGPGAGAEVPHLLYYGHYDVQPPEPLELWDSPPFEPTIVDARHGPRVVARGAVDDKGQVMTFLEAFRAWHAVHGTLPVRVSVLLEGEEETGSPSLVPFLKANAAELKADVCIITDTNSWDIETPAITTRLRGLLYVEVTLHGPSHDLHSGLFGGAVLNPINALTRILGRIHDDAGRVRFPGFYDGVEEPAAEELAMWRDLGFDEAAFLAGVGLTAPAGEAGRSLPERLWSRPTCDINGIIGGYTGEGAKTVIAAQATAKFSCRLVPGQDPDRVLAGIRTFLEEHTPPDGRWEIRTFGKSPAFRVPPDSPHLRAALAGLGDVFAKPAVLLGSGGSIPVAGYVRDELGYDTILVGFGLDDDRIHSPNEKFELKCLHNGIRAHAAMLARFAAPAAG